MHPVAQLGQWLSTFTYENLTKLDHKTPRTVDTVLSEHQRIGAGGTCFSMVNLASQRAQKLGLESRFYLGDRPDGEARHCVIGFPGEGLFLDPGYHCFRPLPLNPVRTRRVVRTHNTLILKPLDDTHLKVSTARRGQSTWRYTLTTEPVNRNLFERAWQESFGWTSVMNSRVLTRLRDGELLLYLNGRLEAISRDRRTSLESPPELSDNQYLSNLFGIDPSILHEHGLSIDS